jgi:4-nitrophenyl phosphatase
MKFSEIKAVVSDMDGVLWRSTQPLPGLLEFVAFLREQNIPFALATNNAGMTPANYVRKLESFGVSGVEDRNIITSGTTTAIYLQSRYPAGTKMYVVGNPGLHTVIEEAGFTLTDDGAEVVIAAVDYELTYEKLKKATLLIRAGAVFIGPNADKTFPIPEGLAPGAGSILAAIATATDQQPITMGKPDAPMFEAALKILGSQPAETLMIGDRLETDILGAQRLGFKTALVLSGVATRDDLITSEIQPDVAYDDLLALTKAWKMSLTG